MTEEHAPLGGTLEMDAPAIPPENGRQAGVGPSHARADMDHSMPLPAAVEAVQAVAAPERKRSSLPMPPRIEQWVDVPGFDGHQVKLWLTYPTYLRTQMEEGDQEASQAALGQIVLEHNGWPDDEGYELPPPSDPEFWRKLDDYRAAAIFMLLKAQPAKNVAGALQRRRS